MNYSCKQYYLYIKLLRISNCGLSTVFRFSMLYWYPRACYVATTNECECWHQIYHESEGTAPRVNGVNNESDCGGTYAPCLACTRPLFLFSVVEGKLNGLVEQTSVASIVFRCVLARPTVYVAGYGFQRGPILTQSVWSNCSVCLHSDWGWGGGQYLCMLHSDRSAAQTDQRQCNAGHDRPQNVSTASFFNCVPSRISLTAQAFFMSFEWTAKEAVCSIEGFYVFYLFWTQWQS